MFDLTNFSIDFGTTMFVDEADNVSRDGTEHCDESRRAAVQDVLANQRYKELRLFLELRT